MELLNVLYPFLIAWTSMFPIAAQGNIANCSDPLGLSTNQISDDSFFATTWQPGRSDPWYGRLKNESRRSWCSVVSDNNQYIQVDLGPKLRRITAVASQGSHNYDEWVTKYKLSYSSDGGKWEFFEDLDTAKIFDANNDRGTAIKHQIEPPVLAVALRFHPVAWSGDMCMRVEAFGCDAFSEALGVENSSIIQDEYLTASGNSYNLFAQYGRLNNIGKAWLSVERDREPGTFLQISIGRQLSIITAVATQGHDKGDVKAWVLTYKLRFSAWGDEWMDYTDDGKVQVFPGNNDVNTVVKNYLRHNITAMLIRFFPETYVGFPALRVEVYGGKAVCQDPLGAENGDLLDLHFTASSDDGPEKVPSKSRLNNARAAWCAEENDNEQYLQVDLGRARTVSRVATQGHPVSTFWVTSYGLAYSLDGIFWRNALDESKSMSLEGNTDQNTVKEVSLYKHVTARFLRFRPEAWNEEICMRIEIYGCEECAHPIGVERGLVPNEAFSASSWYDVDHEPWLARLYSREGEGAWCALENDGAQYLQVDLAQTHIITGVATQGKYEVSEWAIRFRAWVTNYSLSFTDGQMTWINYVEDGNSPKIFDGNSQSNQVVRHTLLKRIISRHLRFLPVTWSGWTCMRVEIFGCRACSAALGMEDYHIPDSSILSTSKWNSYHSYRGRLFLSTQAWMGERTDRNSFLQITVGITDHVITAVATQADQINKMAVVKFQLSFSSDGLHWFDYREDGEVRVFTSTPLTNTVTKHFLKQNVTARFVRFWPKEWFGRRRMRVEVYGCEVCTRSIDASNMTGNVGHPNIFTYDGSILTPWQGSLKINDESPESSWCADSNDKNKIQFLQLDFKVVKVFQAIAIQSHSSEDKYVREFTISSSLDGIFWKQYTEGGVLKVFKGNTYRHTVVKVNIKYNLRARYLRIYPTAWMNHPCLRLEVFSKEDCSDPLGMENGQISDEVITASSALRVNYEPWLARLHSQLGEGAWCAGKNSENQYLQVDLQHLHHVKRVATQGKYPVPGCITPDAWVTSYTMQFRQDMMDWWNYTEDGKAKVFSGNSDTSGVVTHNLRNPVIARYVRFRPVNWFNRICIRVEIYGCKAYFQPLGMEDFSIPKQNINSNVQHNIFNTRLNYGGNQFVGGQEEVTLQINLGQVRIVTAVASQGRHRISSYVRTYRLAFSRHEGEWFYYKETGKVKDMQGNTYPDVTVLNVLQYQVITRYVRFELIEWIENVCIRVEIYGCETRTDPLGIASGVVSNGNMTSSSHSGPGNEPWMARLNVVPDTKAWCAASSDPSPYLQVDLGRVVVVTQVAVAGKSGEGMVTTFKLSSSNEGGFWRKYATVTGEEVFTAAVDYSQAFNYTLALKIKARFFRFLPETWTDLPCMRVELYGYEECTWPLGLKEWIIPNDALSASSSLSTNYLPWMGRLGAKVGAGAWCSKNNDNAQYLQIDLGHVNQIRSLGIQGKEGVSRHPTVESAWVKNFTVSYSVDGWKWTDHEEDGVSKVFLGNSNPHEVRFVSLEVAIYGRHVRIFPQSWHQHICMRVELYGCQVCGDPLGMENHEIPDHALLATSSYFDPKGMRLHKTEAFLLPAQVNEFVQVDLGPGGKTVTAVTIEGRFTTSNRDWITKFVLNYSRDGCEFSSYMENGAVKTFQNPPENYMFPSKYRLQHNITARYIRVLLKDWIKRPHITMELYGCEACSESNGIGNDAIQVSSSSASSSRPSHEPEKAQLLSHTGSWCAAQQNEGQNLQLDFEETMMLTGIATQGHHSNDEYVSKYTLQYSLDGTIWFEYIHSTANDVNDNELDANTDSSSINKIKFLYEVKARYLRIVAKLWHNGICLRVQVFGYKGCDEDLGMENSKIPSLSINASSYLGEGYEPWNARYNRHHGSGAWCARDNALGEFIQVQLTRVHVISRVALQRKEKTSPSDAVEKAWVTKFVVSYSEDGSTWSDYSEGSGVKEFVGHGNKRYRLANTVHARFVRVVVKEWTNHICLRMELYGCQACLEPLGLENFQIPDDSIAVSSEVRSKERIRLGYYKGSMWCARHFDLNQFVKIDLGKRKTITAIATQGNAFDMRDARLKEYYLEYSDDDSNWQEYTHKGQRKIFQGYKTQADISREFLPQPIQARHIKLRFSHYYYYVGTKLEIYGCEA
ncbi:hypothetical protein ACROYT_G005476 [Oculina patagonica]